MTTPRERELEALLAAERSARLEAEAAMQARDEILGVVLHDLRNPLGTLLMGASTLLHASDPTDPQALRVRGVADRMQRQTERMARLLQDVADYSAIIGGTFAVQPERVTAAQVVEAARAALAPIAADRDVVVDAGVDGEVPALHGELDRIVQLVVALGSLGVKVGPRAARLALRLARGTTGIDVVLEVPLPSITDAELPHLFERSWRCTAAGYTGAGLVFALAQGIAIAHGGEVRVTRASPTTLAFTATIPAAPP